MSTIRVILVVILTNNFAIAQAPQGKQSDLYDTWKIECVGNSYFETDSIRTGLAPDRAVHLAGADETPVDRYLQIVRGRIARGYLNNCFRDVEVSTAVNAETGMLTATIDEGFRLIQGDVVVAGLSASECELVASLLKSGLSDSNPFRKSQPKLTYWNKTAAMPFVTPAEAMYRRTVQEALTAIGYPLAEFTIALSESSEGDKQTVDSSVEIASTDTALTVGEITFTGLKKNTPEQMLAFLELKSGLPLTLSMRETIVRKLLDSGRFLMAEVTHEPFYFDPAEPLNLNIRVREYDLVPPLDEELTDFQQTLIKTSAWFKNWPELGEDLHIKFSAATQQADGIVKSIVPPEYHALCGPALGTGNRGVFCIDLMASPTIGSVLTIQIMDDPGTASLKRTFVLTRSAQGFLAWQHQKKWQRSNSVSVRVTQSMLGEWGNEHETHAQMSFSYGINSSPDTGFRPEFKTTAAAVIHLMNAVPADKAVFEANQCRITTDLGSLELDRKDGVIQRLHSKSREVSLEITSGEGLVEAELLRLQEATKDWQNECQPGRELPALAAMILDDVKENQVMIEDLQIGEKKVGDVDSSKNSIAGVDVLLPDLLSHEPALDRWSKAMGLMKESHTFRIPQEKPSTGNVSGLLACLPFFVPHVPAGSFPHQLGLIIFDAQSTGDYQVGGTLLMHLLNEKKHGAICCCLVARLAPGQDISRVFAKAGLERLSAAEFQHDVAPFIEKRSAFREMLCAVLVWLQNTGDKEIESLAQLVEQNIKDQNGNPMNIRPLLLLVRSQREKSAEDVLASLVPIVWEGGLRGITEADLKTLAMAPVPASTKKYFGTPAMSLHDALMKPTAENDATKKNSRQNNLQGHVNWTHQTGRRVGSWEMIS